MARIIVTGDKQIDRYLQRLGSKVANKIVIRRMRESMKLVAARARQNETVGKTADLKGAIIVRATKRSRSRRGIAVAIDEKDLPRYYAAFHEFGAEGRPPGGEMRRTYDETKNGARSVAMNGIRDDTVNSH